MPERGDIEVQQPNPELQEASFDELVNLLLDNINELSKKKSVLKLILLNI